MKKLLAFILILGVGGYFAYRHFFAPGQHACRKLANLCGEQAKDSGKCAEDLEQIRKQFGDDPIKRFDTCMSSVSSCPEAAGCMIGAGASTVGDTLNKLLKGIGKGRKE
jgi:hypothetical protein